MCENSTFAIASNGLGGTGAPISVDISSAAVLAGPRPPARSAGTRSVNQPSWPFTSTKPETAPISSATNAIARCERSARTARGKPLPTKLRTTASTSSGGV